MDVFSFFDFFKTSPMYTFGVTIWNAFISLITASLNTTPQSFSELAWAYTTNTIMMYTMTIGGSLLNIFFMASMIRQCSNFKENLTLEIVIEKLIMVCLANAIFLNGTEIMTIMFKIASLFSGGILDDGGLTFEIRDYDTGASVFLMIFGIIYFAICLVGGLMMFVSVYGRYLQLYLLVGVGPIAWATIPGGHGISSTASSWLRTFLAKTFGIVVIAMTLGITARLCQAINFGSFSGVAGWFDGALQVIQSMVSMVLCAASVMGVDVFMRRTFGL